VKKLLTLLIAVAYLGITSGVMVNIHYCMGRIAEVNYGHDNQDKCSNCGMQQKDGCCKTEHKFIKSTADQLLVKSITQPAPAVAEIPINYPYSVTAPLAEAHSTYLKYHSPPDKRLNDLRVYNSVFRI
jgi:hypothetical protein